MEKLVEKQRRELLGKSIAAERTKSYGTTRYERRTHQSAKTTSDVFNRLDMNTLFKKDILTLKLPVKGETSDYEVAIVFDNICKDISRELKKQNYKMSFKIVYKAIVRALNNQNIHIGCTCKDWAYRFAYQATRGQYNVGKAQLIPAHMTNPRDTLGAGCKHVLKVLDDLDWVMLLALSIYNYISYMEEHMPDTYKKQIFPQIYGMPYEVALRKNIVDGEDDADV